MAFSTTFLTEIGFGEYVNLNAINRAAETCQVGLASELVSFGDWHEASSSFNELARASREVSRGQLANFTTWVGSVVHDGSNTPTNSADDPDKRYFIWYRKEGDSTYYARIGWGGCNADSVDFIRGSYNESRPESVMTTFSFKDKDLPEFTLTVVAE